MTTTVKLAAIASLTVGILLLRWAVAHTFTLALIFAVLATVAVVAGPAVKSAKAKLERKPASKAAPNPVSAITDHAGNVDWDAVVRGYKLPSERDHA